MSKILDLARDFELRSKQQAAAIESNLNSEFERHERAISEALRSSEQRTSDAIAAHSRKMGWMLLKSWGLALVGVLLLLSATSGILWYQGRLIVERQAELKVLREKGGKIEFSTCGDKGRLCVRVLKDLGTFGEKGENYMILKGY